MNSVNVDKILSRPELKPWATEFSKILDSHVLHKKHGHLSDWLNLISSLPDINVAPQNSSIFNQDIITIGDQSQIDQETVKELKEKLLQLKPWRKGPYNFFGIDIDTEWRSDWKWNRIANSISPLQGKNVLDVGCGSGYHCWRMLGDGAEYVLGVDPTLRFFMQFLACQKYLNCQNFDFLPIGIEHMPKKMQFFDTTFSMGVLYHRRDMQQHLIELNETLKPNGELVIETLIIDEDYPHLADGVLVPEERYAAMRNVWNIPTIDRLMRELDHAGFTDIQCIDVNTTSLQEQRRTSWIDGYSLKEFLDPNDHNKTREGYPAPKRATLIAQK